MPNPYHDAKGRFADKGGSGGGRAAAKRAGAGGSAAGLARGEHPNSVWSRMSAKQKMRAQSADRADAAASAKKFDPATHSAGFGYRAGKLVGPRGAERPKLYSTSIKRKGKTIRVSVPGRD